MRASHNRQNHARHYLGLIVTLVVLMSAATVLLVQSRLASAQAVAPSWNSTGNLNIARNGHTATLLPNGKVLVAGGYDGNRHELNSAELYNPDTGAWSITGNLNTARSYHMATLLLNGQVLIAGGGVNDSAELYDPVTGKWSATGNPIMTSSCDTTTRLPNGEVLLVHACDLQAELYNPATGTWSQTGHLSASRYGPTATLLTNGKVLVAGGDSFFGCGSPLSSAELYNPATGTWSETGDLNSGHEYHSGTLLPNGNVLVAGGYDSNYDIISAELYDPDTGTWNNTGNLVNGVFDDALTLLLNGKVLAVSGGEAELYDPTTRMWSSTARPKLSRDVTTLTLLPNGTVLVAGGYGGNDNILNSAELYDPGTSNQIDDAQFFVQQHYLDFLNREPDAGGRTYWTERITGNSRNDPPPCSAGDARCVNERRIGVSAAFFVELEFQDTGYYVYRFYKASFGHQPNYSEFTSDRGKVIGGSNLDASKQAFADEWVQRSAFVAAYPVTMSNTEVVNKFFDSAGLTGSIYDVQRQQEIQSMNAGRSRALVLRDVIEIPDFKNIPDPGSPRYAEIKQTSQYNPAFVLMQYFGYLRRNVDQGGYDFWLDIVNNQQPNNYHGMVCSFLTSTEYQLRFGSVATHSNAGCGQ